MPKKLLMYFILIFFLCLTNVAMAKSVELKKLDVFNLNSRIVRLEISYENSRILEENVTTTINNGILFIDLNNVLPGEVSTTSNVRVPTSARKFIEKIVVNKTQEQHTRFQIHLKSEVAGVKVSLEKADRAQKKFQRIVIDIEKAHTVDVFQEDIFKLNDSTFNAPEYIFDDPTIEQWGFGNNNDNNWTLGDKIIVIDPGHGGSDSGAIGCSGVTEKSVTLAVSKKAQKLLNAIGYEVVMTRINDVDVAMPNASASTELQARVDAAPSNAALFISIHCNAFSNEYTHGMETYHAPTAVKGRRLAMILNEELEKYGGLTNRGVKAANFYVLRHTQCPAALVELGFITNPYEESLLIREDYQQQLAQAIVNAVNRYFN